MKRPCLHAYPARMVCSRLRRGEDFAECKACTARRRGMLFCDEKWAKGFLGQDSGRLAAGRSLLQGLASTPRRRGVPFTRVRRRGLRSMSGRYPYGLGNPPTLRRSSFPQRASRPAGGPIPKHTWGCAPRPPNAKLRLDTNDAKASSVRRRRYAPKVPAAHFILDSAETELK